MSKEKQGEGRGFFYSPGNHGKHGKTQVSRVNQKMKVEVEVQP